MKRTCAHKAIIKIFTHYSIIKQNMGTFDSVTDSLMYKGGTSAHADFPASRSCVCYHPGAGARPNNIVYLRTDASKRSELTFN